MECLWENTRIKHGSDRGPLRHKGRWTQSSWPDQDKLRSRRDYLLTGKLREKSIVVHILTMDACNHSHKKTPCSSQALGLVMEASRNQYDCIVSKKEFMLISTQSWDLRCWIIWVHFGAILRAQNTLHYILPWGSTAVASLHPWNLADIPPCTPTGL